MGLIPKSLRDWFRGILRGGLNAALAEEVAEIQLGVLDANAKVYRKAREVRHEAKQLADVGDEFDRELAAALDASLLEVMELGKTMRHPMTSEERAEVLTHHPLLASGGSPTSLPPAGIPAALTGPGTGAPQTNGTTTEAPIRRGPGRPPGSKNRAKGPNTNGTSHA